MVSSGFPVWFGHWKVSKIFAKDDALITREVSRDKATILVSQSAHPLRRNEHALIPKKIPIEIADSSLTFWVDKIWILHLFWDFLGKFKQYNPWGSFREPELLDSFEPMQAASSPQSPQTESRLGFVGKIWSGKPGFLPQDIKLSCRFSNQSKSQMDGSLRMPQKGGFHGISWNWVA